MLAHETATAPHTSEFTRSGLPASLPRLARSPATGLRLRQPAPAGGRPPRIGSRPHPDPRRRPRCKTSPITPLPPWTAGPSTAADPGSLPNRGHVLLPGTRPASLPPADLYLSAPRPILRKESGQIHRRSGRQPSCTPNADAKDGEPRRASTFVPQAKKPQPVRC